MKRDDITVYEEFARPHYMGRDAGHDFRHIQRIISRLGSFSKGMTFASHKLNFLSCFHGLGERIRDDQVFRGEVTTFLQLLNWEEMEIKEILISLLNHLENPRTPEEMIIHDANYVEVLGAFGIAKAFTTGGARGQTYETTANIFENNLNRVVFFTPEGKRLAKERKSYSQDFLKRLHKELK
jgi:uncharacterized protein